MSPPMPIQTTERPGQRRSRAGSNPQRVLKSRGPGASKGIAKRRQRGMILPVATSTCSRVLFGLNSVLLIAAGRQHLEFRLTRIASLFILALALAGGHWFGAEGVAWATAAVTVGLAAARYLVARRIFALRTTRMPSGVLLSIAVSASLVGLGVRRVLPPVHAVFALLLVGGTYVGVFSALGYAAGYRLPGRRGANTQHANESEHGG